MVDPADDFTVIPPAHPSDAGPSAGDYRCSGLVINVGRNSDGRAWVATFAAAHCGCCRDTRNWAGKYPGMLILPETADSISVRPLLGE